MPPTSRPCSDCSQRRSGFLSRLPSAIRDRVECVMMRGLRRKGEVLARGGRPPTHVHTIQDGLAKVVIEGPHGQPRIVDLLGPGDVAGLEGAFGRPAPYDVVAITEMTTCRGLCSEFRTFLAQEPQVAMGMVDHLLCVSHRSGERLRSLGVNTAVERLAAYFVDGPLPQVEPGKICLPLTRRELAALLGTTPETVARSLHTLVEEELISVDGSEITILDTDGLILRADGEESHLEDHPPPQPPGRPDDSS